MIFYLFYNQLDYVLTNSFAKFKTTKSNVDRFLSDLFLTLFTNGCFIKMLTNK